MKKRKILKLPQKLSTEETRKKGKKEDSLK